MYHFLVIDTKPGRTPEEPPDAPAQRHDPALRVRPLRRAERDIARYRHLNPGTHFGTAPDAKLGADPLRALTHTAHAPVPFPPASQHLTIHSTAPLADHQPTLPPRT